MASCPYCGHEHVWECEDVDNDVECPCCGFAFRLSSEIIYEGIPLGPQKKMAREAGFVEWMRVLSPDALNAAKRKGAELRAKEEE